MPKVLARGVNAVAKSASSHRRYKKGKLRFSKTAPKAKAAQASTSKRSTATAEAASKQQKQKTGEISND